MDASRKFLRLRTPVTIGSHFGDWRITWLGGWTPDKLSYLVMAVRIGGTLMNSRSLDRLIKRLEQVKTEAERPRIAAIILEARLRHQCGRGKIEPRREPFRGNQKKRPTSLAETVAK